MNAKFSKALYLLDMERYEEAEENIRIAISECSNSYELVSIKCCYADFLYGMERYEEAMECVNYVLEHTSEYDDSFERETVIEIKNSIEEEEC